MKINDKCVELNHFDVCQALFDYVQKAYPTVKIVPRFRGAVDINNFVKILDGEMRDCWVNAVIMIEE